MKKEGTDGKSCESAMMINDSAAIPPKCVRKSFVDDILLSQSCLSACMRASPMTRS